MQMPAKKNRNRFILGDKQLENFDANFKMLLNRFPEDIENCIFYARGKFSSKAPFVRQCGYKGNPRLFIQLFTYFLKQNPMLRIIFLGTVLLYLHDYKDLALMNKLMKMINLDTEGQILNTDDFLLKLGTV